MSKTILIVDDAASIRMVAKIALEGAGYHVLEACDGVDALKKLDGSKVHLIISDLNMPNMDGMELLKRIREMKNDDVIFLMITGHPSIGTAVEAINRGADDYITKPFHLDDVKLRISKALEKQTLKGRLKTAQGLAWGLMLSIPLWLLLGIILVILFKG